MAKNPLAPHFAEDEFLSPYFEGKAYRLVSLPVAGEARADLADKAGAMMAMKGSFATAKVDVSSVSALGVLEDIGFRLVDTNVLLEKEVASIQGRETGVEVRSAEPGDEAAVRRLARENLVTSRFHLDPRISEPVASAIKEEWAGNYFTGRRGQDLLVAEVQGRVVGFIQLLLADGLITIDLVAVSGEARRKGVASSLVAHAQAVGGEYHAIRVGTQIANEASLRFYQAVGFRVAGAKYVLHAHGSGIC